MGGNEMAKRASARARGGTARATLATGPAMMHMTPRWGGTPSLGRGRTETETATGFETWIATGSVSARGTGACSESGCRLNVSGHRWRKTATLIGSVTATASGLEAPGREAVKKTLTTATGKTETRGTPATRATAARAATPGTEEMPVTRAEEMSVTRESLARTETR